jgi:3-dehydroquinate dehydratase
MIYVTLANMDSEQISEYAVQYQSIELRTDLLDLNLYEYQELFSSNYNIILTVNLSKSLNIQDLLSLANISNLDAVCIDLDFYMQNLEIISKFDKLKIILAKHIYENLNYESIENLLKQADNYNTEYIKIAMPVNSNESLDFIKTYLNKYGRKIIFTGTGKYALQSRALSMKMGAPIMFASPDEIQMIANQPKYTEILDAYKAITMEQS